MAEKKGTAREDIAPATRTCFVMMPISDVDGYPVGHFSEVYNQLIHPAVEAAGYECILATSTSAAHMIQLEVVTRVATADLCICDLSTNNPNVLFEYGIRQAFDLPTVLIKDDRTRRIFDLNGFRDIEYDHTLRIAKTLSTREAITKAIAHTVDSAGDETQVFSLVKLMKLAKAALPAGEVSQSDARFTLIENKLDSLSSMLRREVAVRSDEARISVPREPDRLNFRNGYDARFRPEGLIVFSREGGTKEIYRDQPSLERSDFWKSLGVGARDKVSEKLIEYCPDFIPF